MACIFYNMPYVFFCMVQEHKKRDFVVGKTKIHGILIFKENYQKGSISWQKYSW